MESKPLSQKELNKLELRILESVLYSTADIIDALMKDGVPYTKLTLGGPNANMG